MKRVIAGMLVVGLLATVMALPVPAEAGGRYYGHGHGHGHGYGAGPFIGGLAVGAVTGLVVGGILAPRVVVASPPPVVYQPAPVVVAPAPVVYAAPPPVCTTQWVNTYWNGYGWTPAHWQQVCR